MTNDRLLCAILILSALSAASAASVTTCERKCGDVDIPYPFGLDDPSCVKYNNTNFLLGCNRTANSPPKPFLRTNNIEVLNISLENATMSVKIPNPYTCYNESGSITGKAMNLWITLGPERPFTFSNTENKLIGLGCNTMAFMADSMGKFRSGCLSICEENVDFAKDGQCLGFGCCETSVPKNVKSLSIAVSTYNNHKYVTSFNPCVFVMLVDQRSFNVSEMKLNLQPGDPFVDKASGLIDWVVGNQTCEEAKAKGDKRYACGANAECSYSDNGKGYRCHCKKGFRGNPYRDDLLEGCEDIDECKEAAKYKCEWKCKNTIGDYECKCPLGMHVDGKVGCQGFRVTAIATIIGANIFAAIIAPLIFHDCKRRKREKIFRENSHNYVDTILDPEVSHNQEETVQIKKVAELATKCLYMSGARRPSMKAVADELARLSKLNGGYKAPHDDDEETELLLTDSTRKSKNVSSIELVEYSTYEITEYELEPSSSFSLN